MEYRGERTREERGLEQIVSFHVAVAISFLWHNGVPEQPSFVLFDAFTFFITCLIVIFFYQGTKGNSYIFDGSFSMLRTVLIAGRTKGH